MHNAILNGHYKLLRPEHSRTRSKVDGTKLLRIYISFSLKITRTQLRGVIKPAVAAVRYIPQT